MEIKKKYCTHMFLIVGQVQKQQKSPSHCSKFRERQLSLKKTWSQFCIRNGPQYLRYGCTEEKNLTTSDMHLCVGFMWLHFGANLTYMALGVNKLSTHLCSVFIACSTKKCECFCPCSYKTYAKTPTLSPKSRPHWAL